MSFADPQSVTINAVATSLPRTGSGVNAGTFSSADGLVTMSISSAYGKRVRRTIRLTQVKTAADTYVPATNAKYSQTVYIVVDTPVVGFSVTEQKYLVDALSAYLAASSGAKVTQLLGGEN